MENAKRRGVPGEVSLLLAAVIWGGAFVAQSLGGDSLGPLSFNASRSLIGALALVPVILWNDRRKGTGRPKGRERRLLWLGGALCGICLTLAVNLQQVAIAWVDASGRANVGKIGFLTAMYIVLVPILSLFLKKRVGANVYAGILLALAGMYLLCVKEGFALGGGDVYALLAALMFALQIIVIDIFAPKVDNIRLSALQFLVCGAVGRAGAGHGNAVGAGVPGRAAAHPVYGRSVQRRGLHASDPWPAPVPAADGFASDEHGERVLRGVRVFDSSPENDRARADRLRADAGGGASCAMEAARRKEDG